MKRIVLIVCALVAGTSVVRAEPFEAALHRQLRSNKGNFIYSPASLRIALAMAMAGARGATQAELSKALQLPAEPKTAYAIGYLGSAWDGLDPDKVVLRVRDRVWVQDGFKLVDAYVNTLRDDFHSEIGVADFAHNADGARDAINQWVADATQNMIPSLLGPGQPTPRTKMALTNVVYFKGKWTEPFYDSDTREDPFFADGKKQVKARTMHQVLEEKAARVEGALVLQKAYGNGRLVMDIVLPTKRDGLAAIEDAYTKGALPDWLKKLDTYLVDVALPKFEMSSTVDLIAAMRGLGIRHATSDRDADFSGIADGEHHLYIDEALQKAIVEVEETGTKAAAVTYFGVAAPMMAMGDSKPPQKLVFHADHPFFFVIRDVTEDWVLFAGRVVDPTAK